ncbi:uncharacterized protein LOC135206562 [Macrobrachium nipponense]|uniref:uncharacterized protein LOC135206562 n=1 Tax=Macrobrachium nipponense TaxID=159736 RepID=UPI0030C88401
MWSDLQRKEEKGYYDNLMRELATETPGLYRNFTRIKEELFNKIAESVKKKLTFWRRPIEPDLHVAITLCYLATGESYKSLAFQFRVVADTVCGIVPETCMAIVAAYGDEVEQSSMTPEQWKEVVHSFEEYWNFPHTLGAIDKKLIRTQISVKGGTQYYNHKRFYSCTSM